jgi:hypothetical protein
LGLSLQAAAGLNALEVAVDVEQVDLRSNLTFDESLCAPAPMHDVIDIDASQRFPHCLDRTEANGAKAHGKMFQ